MQLLIMKQDKPPHYKGDIVEIRASDTPFTGSEPDVFVLVKVPDEPMTDFEGYNLEWQRELAFEDEDGNSVVPNSLKYSLLKDNRKVVNSQQDITVSPATSVDVTLSGDDLPPGKLYWVVEGTYDSSAGTDLPLKGYATFNVQRLPEA